MGADMNKINQLLEHLNISQVFIAGQIPTDMINFCEENPEKVSHLNVWLLLHNLPFTHHFILIHHESIFFKTVRMTSRDHIAARLPASLQEKDDNHRCAKNR